MRARKAATIPRCKMLLAPKSRARLVATRPGHTTLKIGEGLENGVSYEWND